MVWRRYIGFVALVLSNVVFDQDLKRRDRLGVRRYAGRGDKGEGF